MTSWNKGKPMSEEQKLKISAANKGKKSWITGTHRGSLKCVCGVCKKVFWKNKYAISKRGEGKFCSKKCYGESKKGITPEQLIKTYGKPSWNKGKRGIGGDKHWNWKGGITPKNKEYRARGEWKLWRESVFKRDGYACKKCAAKSGEDGYIRLEPHHIFRIAKLIKNKMEKHIFNIDNGITLCDKCHKITFKGNF